ncbi:MAG TPA: hypothetical protein PK913_06840 [Phenylobacterium sp.]|jgi:hypothetical protein|uniref:Carbonic anhydrase n=1 Tax=Phenylobacterium conjunctum TaxID=1298959 RepID=A0ABW3T6L5_9CAUL|nr:hypothetical protein [Phenylobacterium sp.]
MNCLGHSTPRLSRRTALSAIALGGGASLLSSFMPGVARASGHAEALLLTCMDYRLVDDVTRYMDARGLTNKYDHVILAGASLGALNDKFPTWNEVFWTHIDLAVQLHEVHRVIIIDHKDCGAYKLVLGEASVKDADTELKTHVKQLYALRSQIVTRHPHMEVELGLMALDGTVTQIV